MLATLATAEIAFSRPEMLVPSVAAVCGQDRCLPYSLGENSRNNSLENHCSRGERSLFSLVANFNSFLFFLSLVALTMAKRKSGELFCLPVQNTFFKEAAFELHSLVLFAYGLDFSRCPWT